MDPLQAIMSLLQAPQPKRPVSVRPDYGLTGAQVLQTQKSPYERTLRPGETRSAEDLQGMLAEVIMAAGSNALPGAGPRGQARQAPARVRPGFEGQFKEWFGGSKVVNEKGEPLTVYHGTNRQIEKETFDFSRRGENAAHPSANLGLFFAKDPALAGSFAERTGGQIKPVHLKMKNPLVIEAKEFASDLDFWQGMKGVRGRRGEESQYSRSAEYFERMREMAQDAGHDGIIIRGSKAMAKDYPELVRDNYVAFEPGQIKSATGNRGTYDPNSPRIDE